MPNYELRTLNLSPAFAIQCRVLVLSQTLHFYIVIGTMPPSAEMLELSGNSADSTLAEQQQSTEILKALSQIDAACPSLKKLSTTPAGTFQANSPQKQCP